MQLWEADFSSLTAEGSYVLHIEFGTSDGVRRLQSMPFEIRRKLVTSTILKPMSLDNGEIRRGADEDFWRNWIRNSGSWHVGVDGAFIADRADAQNGSVLTRVFGIDNNSLEAEGVNDFRFVGRVTIVSGCDAQMRFEDVSGNWWAVTLQAGAAGACAFGSGPGSVRLSREGTGGFEALASNLFPVDKPFQAGHAYDLEILVMGDQVQVFVDQIQGSSANPVLQFGPVPHRSGRFGLKGWAATVRFEEVQAWNATVQFTPLSAGSVRIPTFRNRDLRYPEKPPEWVPCQYAPRDCADDRCRHPVDSLKDYPDPKAGHSPLEAAACNPIFSQLHGFHDSSSQVAEATSHGAFLSGLMTIWRTRASGFNHEEKEQLRRAIITNVLYLNMLFQEGGREGQFAHSEMGRVEVWKNGLWNTEAALYGLSDFADKGVLIDRGLARQACFNAIMAAKWRWPTTDMADNPFLASVVYPRLARCAARDSPLSARSSIFSQLALHAAEHVLNRLSVPGGIGNEVRDTGRITPWLEGVYEVLESHPEMRKSYIERLNQIATILVEHLTKEHKCDETVISGRWCPANGFYVLPQGSGDATIAKHNWVHMDGIPHANRTAALPFVHWYNVQGHFQATLIDTVLLARLTGNANLEPIATGNLYWMLGLNPGIPTAKIVGSNGDGTVWQASSFIRGLTTPFARAHEGFRREQYAAKGWLDSWEDSADSPRREAWRIDPQNRFNDPPMRSFLTTVNGHVLWDKQWDYWNNGEPGWLSGETFILGDGLFLKAAVLFEDWLTQDTLDRINPYDIQALTFFDTTHVDRVGTGWEFDDPNYTQAAQAARAAHEFCIAKGYIGGRFTGHHIGERLGVLCVPTTARFFDATNEQVRTTGWDFDDINLADWAQVARAATGFCNVRSFSGGFFTGHQLNGRHGIVCLGSNTGHWSDATEQDLFNSREGFEDINTVSWAKAARAATNICLEKGFPGGFFTGHQVSGFRGVVCIGP